MGLTDPEALSDRIARLDDREFASLCNRLIVDAGAVAGIPASCFDLTLRTAIPDGGVDARVAHAPATAPRLIPGVTTIYQFKSGARAQSAEALVNADILGKTHVRPAIEAGESFVYLAAWSREAGYEAQIVTELRKSIPSLQDGQITFLGGDTLAHVLLEHTAVVYRFLGLAEDLRGFSEWASQRPHSFPFQADDALARRIEELKVLIQPASAVLRVVGAAGIGKTRTILEALRGTLFESSVVYARAPKEIAKGLVAYLRTTPRAHCTLVVDEVRPAEASELAEAFDGMPKGVRLILIGLDASGRAPEGTVELDGASEETLVRLVQSVVSGIPLQSAQQIARACERSPKLAFVIAQAVLRDPVLASPQAALGDGTVQDALRRYLHFEELDPRWRALSVLALLDHVGWSRAREEECVALFRALSLDPTESRRLIESLDNEIGVAPEAGDYRYVSPQILADFLAAGQINALTRDHLRELRATFSPSMMDALARRVRSCSAILRNRRTIEEGLFGPDGPFRDLAELEQSGTASLLRRLAGPFHRAVLEVLERIIEPATDEELRGATKSRREVMWTVTETLWAEDTFERAAWLLLRLAASENETWGNNATGTWEETFHCILGRTAAPMEARRRVLERAATHPDAQYRVLAAQGLAAVLDPGPHGRLGMPPEDVPEMPEAWRPKTNGELWDARAVALKLLAPLLDDSDARVRLGAVKAMVTASRAVLPAPRLARLFIEVARPLAAKDFELRAPVARAIEDELRRAREALREPDPAPGAPEGRQSGRTPAAARSLETMIEALDVLRRELSGSDFSSRFRASLTRGVVDEMEREDDIRGAETRIADRIRSLANEVIADPQLLDGEWPWLLSSHPGLAYSLFKILGSVDMGRTLAAELRGRALASPAAIPWWSLYEVSFAVAAGSAGHVNDLLRDLEAASAPGAMLFDLAAQAGPDESRLAVLRRLLESGRVPGSSLAALTWSEWRERSSPEAIRDLAVAALSDEGAASALVGFIEAYLKEHEAALPVLRDVAVRLLTAAMPEDRSGVRDYQWCELAGLVAVDEPRRVLEMVLRFVAMRGSSVRERLRKLALECWSRVDRREVFLEEVGPWLETKAIERYRVRDLLDELPLWDAGQSTLEEWVATDPHRRLRALAQVCGEVGETPTPLQDWLLAVDGGAGVGGILSSKYLSGSHSGPLSGWYESQLARLRSWLRDARPHIRAWAEDAAKRIRAILKDVARIEEEERFER